MSALAVVAERHDLMRTFDCWGVGFGRYGYMYCILLHIMYDVCAIVEA